MRVVIPVTPEMFGRLDLSPALPTVASLLDQVTQPDQTNATETNTTETNAIDSLGFEIQYSLEPTDPRELSEVPEVRLWFIRLDSAYPWLPLYLDWEAGELARYVAMLVPHQFSPLDGIRYNPEALEIFVMQRVFSLHDWLQKQGIEGRNRLKQMTQLLGYELDDALFNLL
jgi:hypothetical protein